jgi:hypothetical protein
MGAAPEFKAVCGGLARLSPSLEILGGIKASLACWLRSEALNVVAACFDSTSRPTSRFRRTSMATSPPDWADRQGGKAFSEQGPDRLCHGLADQQRKTRGAVIAERTNKATTLATSKSS